MNEPSIYPFEGDFQIVTLMHKTSVGRLLENAASESIVNAMLNEGIFDGKVSEFNNKLGKIIKEARENTEYFLNKSIQQRRDAFHE